MMQGEPFVDAPSFALQTDYVDFEVSDDEEPEQPASKRVRLDSAQDR
jgi:hypothetical protein